MNNSKTQMYNKFFSLIFFYEIRYYINFLYFLLPNKTLKYFCNMQHFFRFLKKNFFLQFENKNYFSKYEQLSINFHYRFNFNIQIKLLTTNNSTSLQIFKSKLFFFSKIISLLFFFNSHILNTLSKLHFNYKLLFGRHVGSFLWINNNKFITVWFNAFSFIYNIFYFNLNPLLYGSIVFKKEILSFNWQFFSSDIFLWKFSFSFFIFKTTIFTKKLDFFYKKIYSMDVDFVFISDTFYHMKNLYYFNKHKIFTLGLISASVDPWLVSYAIPMLTNGILTEFFFYKNLIILQQYSLLNRHELLKKNWLYLQINTLNT